MYGEEERCMHSFGGETRRKKPLERPRLRWEDNISWLFRSGMWNMDWIDLAHKAHGRHL
jgi:hypothetical protein